MYYIGWYGRCAVGVCVIRAEKGWLKGEKGGVWSRVGRGRSRRIREI